MVAFSYLLPLAAICNLAAALPPSIQMLPNVKVGNLANTFSFTDKYPMANDANVPAHDPNILETNGAFYLFKGGVHLPILRATDLNGPWKEVGTVLKNDSLIKGHGNGHRPWAPTTIEWKGQFYCFYAVSGAGSRHSAIGVASTKDIEKGWKDHGTLFTTGDKNQGTPFNETNAIDPSFVVDQNGAPFLNYGSYWNNIWQVPLNDDLLSLKNNTILRGGASKPTTTGQKSHTRTTVHSETSSHASKDHESHTGPAVHAVTVTQSHKEQQSHTSTAVHTQSSTHASKDHESDTGPAVHAVTVTQAPKIEIITTFEVAAPTQTTKSQEAQTTISVHAESPTNAPKNQDNKAPSVKAAPGDSKKVKRDDPKKQSSETTKQHSKLTKEPSKPTKEPNKLDNKNDKPNKNDKVDNKDSPKLENQAAVQLTFEPGHGPKPEEGSFISQHGGFYYLWFSHGKCCDFEKGLPKKGDEYVFHSPTLPLSFHGEPSC